MTAAVVNDDSLTFCVAWTSTRGSGTVLIVRSHDGTRALTSVKLLVGTVHAVDVGSNGRAGKRQGCDCVEGGEFDHLAFVSIRS